VVTPPLPPVHRYEQVARDLRRRIFEGEFPPGARLPGGQGLAGEYGASQHMGQRAIDILAREGLVRATSGSGTDVLERRQWSIDATAPLPSEKTREQALAEVARVNAALDAAVQPAIPERSAQLFGALAEKSAEWAMAHQVKVFLTVESADLPGAVAAALPVIRAALAPLEIVRQGAEPA
jgi:DNA-binding transcriptional regulator YhcF (GntR family)